MAEDCHIRPMQESDIELVLAWRNHPEVRRYMLTQHEISLQEHRRWFERASEDDTRRLMIVEANDQAIGFVHFTGVSRGGVADWGFYAAPDAPKGSGRKLGVAALNFAFNGLELHKVCGQALAFNSASIRFHCKLGFRQEGVLRDRYRLGDAYHDLICFGILSHEWCAHEQG